VEVSPPINTTYAAAHKEIEFPLNSLISLLGPILKLLGFVETVPLEVKSGPC
jgi:hypothetical protein